MRFRKYFFTILALISLAWIAYGLSVTGGAVESTSQGADARYEAGSVERASATVGIGIGASLGLAFFLCTGLPFLLLFSFLAWRNNVGLRQERHHKEVMAAMQRSE